MPAGVKDPKGAVPRITEFWASVFDCFLQDWKKAAHEEDAMDFMIATAKLEQAGSALRDMCDQLSRQQMQDKLDIDNYNSATSVVANFIEEKLNGILQGAQNGDEESPDTVRTFQ